MLTLSLKKEVLTLGLQASYSANPDSKKQASRDTVHPRLSEPLGLEVALRCSDK